LAEPAGDCWAIQAAEAVTTLERLAGRLEEAEQVVAGILPLDTPGFDADGLDARTGLLLDGFRTRFAELEDVMGRVVPLAARLNGMPATEGEEPSVGESLEWLAGRGALDEPAWRAARELRNQLTHPEPGDGPDRAELLNRAWYETSRLLSASQRLVALVRREVPGGVSRS
jgi:hypothetical protein